MAEGLAKHFLSNKITAFSAGIEKHGLNKMAVKVMNEIGIDISNNQSKTINELSENSFDFVITLCGHAHETCPFFPAKTKILHQGFDDPPFLTKELTNEKEILNIYRRVRDEIKNYIFTLPYILEKEDARD
jgi:arsenate reductase